MQPECMCIGSESEGANLPRSSSSSPNSTRPPLKIFKFSIGLSDPHFTLPPPELGRPQKCRTSTRIPKATPSLFSIRHRQDRRPNQFLHPYCTFHRPFRRSVSESSFHSNLIFHIAFSVYPIEPPPPSAPSSGKKPPLPPSLRPVAPAPLPSSSGYVALGSSDRSADPDALVLTESASPVAAELLAKSENAVGGVQDGYGEDTATEDQHVTHWAVTVASGYTFLGEIGNAVLLRDPYHNKGLAFAKKERDAHYLRSLLPPTVISQELQVRKMIHNIRQYQVPLQKYMAMTDMQLAIGSEGFGSAPNTLTKPVWDTVKRDMGRIISNLKLVV